MFWIKIVIIVAISGMKPIYLYAEKDNLRLVDSAHATIPNDECYKLALPYIVGFGRDNVNGLGADYTFTCTHEDSE